jgi:hypothetical protein
MRRSRIDGGPTPSAIPAPRAIGTGSISVLNDSGGPVYGAQDGSMIPFVLLPGQVKTIRSIAGTYETIKVWNSDGRGPVGPCRDKKGFEVVADMDMRVLWTGYQFRNA